MDEKQTRNYAVQKTKKCPFNTVKKPKKNGNPENNWPEPESRSFIVPTITQNLNFIFNIAWHIRSPTSFIIKKLVDEIIRSNHGRCCLRKRI